MSGASDGPIGAVHTPLRQAVTDAIRERIVDGTYPAGSRLMEETIAGELAVSRNPVREAFQLLANEGFVEIEPRRGARVAAVDERQASEIFEVRAVLEGLVAARAARRATPESASELADIVAAGTRAAADRELGTLPMLNTRFHSQLAAMADNELLTSMLDQLSGLIRWIYAERLEARVLNSWHEHTELSAAIAAGDEEQARRLAIDHVQSAREAFMTADTDA